jgi:hypothetical protein
MAADVFTQAGHNLAVVIRAGPQAGEPALQRVGALLDAQIKRKLSEPGRGRIYVRRSRVHQASAPGDPPAVDTGKYRASWSWVVHKVGEALELIVGTPDIRGPSLEYGTSRMDKRPHLRPVVEAARAAGTISKTIAGFISEFQRRRVGGLRGR